MLEYAIEVGINLCVVFAATYFGAKYATKVSAFEARIVALEEEAYAKVKAAVKAVEAKI